MDTQEGAQILDHVMALEYEITIREQGGMVYARATELNLITEGGDAAAAYQNLKRAKQELFERFIAIGQQSQIPLPARDAERQIFFRQVKPFLFKSAVVALVAGLLIVAANVSITYTIRESPRHLAQVAGLYMLTTFAGELEKFAEKEMSPDREARIHRALRMTAARLKPFAGDLAPLFQTATVGGDATDRGQAR